MNRGKDFYRWYHARQTKKHRRNKYRLPLFLSSYGAWVVNKYCSAYALQSYLILNCVLSIQNERISVNRFSSKKYPQGFKAKLKTS